MAEFVWLQKGDKLPAVAISQMLLNRTGAELILDGNFGRATKSAVMTFQREHSLAIDGVVGRQTWLRLVRHQQLPICDAIDVFDPDLMTSEQQFLTGAGGQPLVIGGMSNGTEQIISDITARHRNLFMVRFHGHGAKGIAGVSDGEGTLEGSWESRTNFAYDLHTRDMMTKLGRVIGPYGCIQFMHCQTGGGTSGKRFLQMVADAAGVPASAAIRNQYAYSLRKTLRYEGPTRTCCPGGVTMREWATRLPAFVGLSFV